MKLIADEQDLLNDSKLDEMQKAYAYKLAFKCFKALYWSNMVFAYIPLLFQNMTNKSPFYAIISMLLFIVSNIIYLVFGVKASKVGAMNPSFAKHMAQPRTMVSAAIMFILYVTVAVLNFIKTGEGVLIYFGVYVAIMTSAQIALGCIAKKNNKLLEEAEDEE